MDSGKDTMQNQPIQNIQRIYPLYKEFFGKNISKSRMEQLYEQILNIPTEYVNTHPAYADRIKAISFSPELPEMAAINAAEGYFEGKLENYISGLEKCWESEIEDTWSIERDSRLNKKQRLAELEMQIKERELTINELYSRARWTEDISGIHASYPLYLDLLAKDSLHAKANYFVGKKQILDGNEEGIEKLKKAVERNLKCVIPGTDLIYEYYVKTGNKEEAENYYKQQDYRRRLFYKFNYYCNNLNYREILLGHDLPDNELNRLKEYMSKHSAIKEVYLVKKEISDRDIKEPIYVMFIRFEKTSRNKKIANNIILRKISNITPQNTLVINLDNVKDKRYINYIRNLRNTALYCKT